jgi:hypothetical protein
MEQERYLLGKQLYIHGKVYTFKCPTCGKLFTYDEPGEPGCTGPNEVLDEHDMTLMHLVSVRTLDKREVALTPDQGRARADGPLYVPTDEDKKRRRR